MQLYAVRIWLAVRMLNEIEFLGKCEMLMVAKFAVAAAAAWCCCCASPSVDGRPEKSQIKMLISK